MYKFLFYFKKENLDKYVNILLLEDLQANQNFRFSCYYAEKWHELQEIFEACIVFLSGNLVAFINLVCTMIHNILKVISPLYIKSE